AFRHYGSGPLAQCVVERNASIAGAGLASAALPVNATRVTHLDGRIGRARAPGRLLAGRYRVEARIADGGMGMIYRARRVPLERPVALKIIKSELVQYPELVGRFLQEARCGARLQSPHTTRVLDAGEDDAGRPFFAMELLIGSDLGELLERQGTLPMHSALDYL